MTSILTCFATEKTEAQVVEVENKGMRASQPEKGGAAGAVGA